MTNDRPRYSKPVLRAMVWSLVFEAAKKDMDDIAGIVADEYEMDDEEWSTFFSLFYGEVYYKLRKFRDDAIAKLDGGIPDPPEKAPKQPDVRGQEW